mmetsp:Transcript_47271/g.83160  ORF Transcript_47271/g.83160 Transcript_47271/m.83160 type:complete len:205 (+) Transcript_47271:289-903(+)
MEPESANRWRCSFASLIACNAARIPPFLRGGTAASLSRRTRSSCLALEVAANALRNFLFSFSTILFCRACSSTAFLRAWRNSARLASTFSSTPRTRFLARASLECNFCVASAPIKLPSFRSLFSSSLIMMCAHAATKSSLILKPRKYCRDSHSSKLACNLLLLLPPCPLATRLLMVLSERANSDVNKSRLEVDLGLVILESNEA